MELLTFESLPLPEQVLKGIRDANFETCTPIQSKSLPITLGNKDLAGQAQTGTGKTAAFLITLFTRLLENNTQPLPKGKVGPRALIIAPTRELARQIEKDALLLGKHCQFRTVCVIGGVDYDKQRNQIKAGVDILIATPGRLIDFYKQKFFSLKMVEVLVVDEADRMFDMGFIADLRYLFRACPPYDKRQSMLFSATLNHRVMELCYEHMNNPTHVQVEAQQMTASRVSEELFYPSDDDKIKLLLTLMEEEWPDKAIVFSNTKHGCERVADWLEADGHRVGLLSGDVPQKKRLGILEDFTGGKLDILVATDVAARGLHIEAVSHVFNYDLPDDPEDYVHRIGRTGRAGKSGVAISFACEKYALNLPGIESYIQHAIPVTEYVQDALLDDIKPPKPRQRRQNRRPSSRRNNSGRSSGKRPQHKKN